MRLQVALALDAEYVQMLDARGAENIAELMDMDEADTWAEVGESQRRAEQYHFERNDEHREEMEAQDMMGYT